MDDIIIDIEPESVEIISETEYCDDITNCFVDIPNIAYSLVKNAKKCLKIIKRKTLRKKKLVVIIITIIFLMKLIRITQ